MTPGYARSTSIFRIHPATRDEVRAVARRAVRLFRNAHLGSCDPREDLRSAFLALRSGVADGLSLAASAARLDSDLYRYEDM